MAVSWPSRRTPTSLPAKPASQYAATACVRPTAIAMSTEATIIGAGVLPASYTMPCPSIHPLVPWYENMTSSIKPEVHNVSQRHQRGTEPRPQAICTKIWHSLAKQFSSYVSRQTDRQCTYFANQMVQSKNDKWDMIQNDITMHHVYQSNLVCHMELER